MIINYSPFVECSLLSYLDDCFCVYSSQSIQVISGCSKFLCCFLVLSCFFESLNVYLIKCTELQNAGTASGLPLQIYCHIMDGSGYLSGMYLESNLIFSCSICRFLFLFCLTPIM